MEKSERNIYIGIAIVLLFLVANLVHLGLTKEEVTLEAVVVDAEYIEKGDYVRVTFDNGESYNIQYPGYDVHDLTVNSRLIVKLHKLNWWLWPNTNDVWRVTGYLKVPGD